MHSSFLLHKYKKTCQLLSLSLPTLRIGEFPFGFFHQFGCTASVFCNVTNSRTQNPTFSEELYFIDEIRTWAVKFLLARADSKYTTQQPQKIMGSESEAGYHRQQGILFKSGGPTTSSGGRSTGCELFQMGSYYRTSGRGSQNLSRNGGGRGGGMIFSTGGMDSPSSLLLDSVPGLKHDTGLAVEWSIEEQYKLEEGLAKYASEPNIMRYIKIAAALRDKTVRDVALRCKWMARKRRKQEDQNFVKKVKDQKELLVESSLKNSMSSASSVNPFSLTTNNHDQSNSVLTGGISGTARHLLEENIQAFGQISANLSTLKLQQNIDLFYHARNNISKLLNDMRNMPGIMSRMPPLPVLLNEELASSIFTPSSQSMIFRSPMVTSLKQEPGC